MKQLVQVGDPPKVRKSRRLCTLVVLGFCTASIPLALRAAPPPAPVRVTGGMVQGTPGSLPGVTAYKGIPYAAPPVGNLRWRAPQPVMPWQGVRAADRFGNSCIQKEVYQRKPWTHEFMVHNDISEDCLYLNVWAPASPAAGAKRPVYLFLHGGGDVEGSAAVPVYDGEGLARKGVIVVTLNYRLGIFGFFTHPALTAEAPYHASGNYADLDMLAGLAWIRQNIAQFGGDPDHVTLGGQSAGSRHVFGMMVSPLAKGLFQAAIIESGVHASVITETPETLEQGEKRGELFATAKGARSLADLRNMSWQELFDPAPPGAPPLPVFRGDVIDGYVFPLTPRETYAQGKENDVPVLTGLNLNDNTGPVPNPDITAAGFRESAQKLYGPQAPEFLQLYPAATEAEARQELKESTWDLNRTGFYTWALWHDSTAKAPVYTYFWDHSLPGPDVAVYGAFHTSEVPYVFDALRMSDRPFAAADRTIADTLSNYWVNFIRKGNPNGPGLPPWPSTRAAPDMTMEIGDRYTTIPVAGSKAKEDFFKAYYNEPHAQPRP